MYFSTELNAAEWAEQCQGLGCDMSQGVSFAAFESLFLEYGACGATLLTFSWEKLAGRLLTVHVHAAVVQGEMWLRISH